MSDQDKAELRASIKHTMECALGEYRQASERISRLIVDLSDARRDQIRAAQSVTACRTRLSELKG